MEEGLAGRLPKEEIGRAAFRTAYKERPHISKSQLDQYGSATYIELGNSATIKFRESGVRYIAAIGLTYDTILVLYGINTRSLFVTRFYDETEEVLATAGDFIRGIKGKETIEARIIGMQSNQYPYKIEDLVSKISRQKARIVELDIFGTEKRHIAADAKLGMSMDILTEDRLYRPGELKNDVQLSEFKVAGAQQARKPTQR